MIEWNIDVSQQSDRKLPMDIFVPESDRPRGALLFLHGGGFVGGRKEQFLGICASAALKTGWVCASLDYRLAGKAPFPAQKYHLPSSLNQPVSIAPQGRR